MTHQLDEPTKQPTTPLGRLVSAILSALNACKMAYCVMRNYDGLPDEIGNDLDIAVETKHLEAAGREVLRAARDCHWQVMRQVRRQGTWSIYCGWRRREGHCEFMHVDLWTDSLYRRMRWANIDHLIAGRRRYGGYWVPSPGAEAAMAVRGLLAEGTVRGKYRPKCVTGAKEDKDEFRACLAGYFSSEMIATLEDGMARADWAGLAAMSGKLRRHWRLRAALRRPFSQARLLFRFMAERMGELTEPNGLFVALIGPDGSGKTTIAKGVEQRMGQAVFAASSYKHVRPGWLPSLSSLLAVATRGRTGTYAEGSRVAPSPSTELPVLRALANVCYYWMEFMAAHCMIRRVKSKGHLIIYDRYFFEYFIQIGYRRVPRGLLQALVRMIPQPDFVVYLRNSPDVIRRRKAELTEQEIIYQSRMCEQVIASRNNSVVVDTDKPIDDVVEEVVDHIVDLLQRRAQRWQPSSKG